MDNLSETLTAYARAVTGVYKTNITTEHSYRGCLEGLLNALLPRLRAVNEPRHTECGAPDYALIGRKDGLPRAYVEAKDLFDNDLDGRLPKGHKPQFDRYRQALTRVAFTDYLEFSFYADAAPVARVRLLRLNAKGAFEVDEGERFAAELAQWANCPPQPITTAKRLAELMAHKARLLAEVIGGALKDPEGEITGQYKAFKSVLINDLTADRFADLYAQTITYGMFAARLNMPDGEGELTFTRQLAATLIPMSNPFLRKIFQQIAGYYLDSRIAWIVDDLAEAFAAADVGGIMQRYRQDPLHQDPLIHFYEDFLSAYNPALRKQCGVYYTPQPALGFIVRAVDDVLRRGFNMPGGLADGAQILDPAAGTGTFLAEAVRLIRRGFEGNEGMWPQYVNENLRPRLHGFELLMAPYTITHLKLDMMLGDGNTSGGHGDEGGHTARPYGGGSQRLGVYLTNALEECHPDTNTLWAQWLSAEGAEANAIKRDCPVMVMMGNPPYSISSSNRSEWILKLLSDYKRGLNEKKLNLDDDYIKFIRLGQYYIERNGKGVLGYISNNSYLDGLVHRQMRKSLLEAFDDIYIVNLHGNTLRKETAPDGGKDESVFDIMVGTAIAVFVKCGATPVGAGRVPARATVHYMDLYGLRKEKYAALERLTIENAKWQTLECREPNYFFVPKDFGLQEEYEKGVKIDELFKVYNSGLQTDRDSLFIDNDRNILAERIKTLLSGAYSTDFATRYNVTDSSSYKLTSVIRNKQFEEGFIKPIQYRPFDYQYIYYDPRIISRPASKVMPHMLNGANIGLICCRQASGGKHFAAFITNTLIERSSQPNAPFILFPLYLYDDSGGRYLNMRAELICGREPEEFLAYIYAVLHSPTYRGRYREFLKIDFPRIPQPKSEKEYKRLVGLGQELINLHLMRTVGANNYSPNPHSPTEAQLDLPKYPVVGNNIVDAVRYEGDRVYINETQYFDGVPESAWEFWVGGYQPAQKWLKDRRGRALGLRDITHYQRVVAVLARTAEVMAEIV